METKRTLCNTLGGGGNNLKALLDIFGHLVLPLFLGGLNIPRFAAMKRFDQGLFFFFTFLRKIDTVRKGSSLKDASAGMVRCGNNPITQSNRSLYKVIPSPVGHRDHCQVLLLQDLTCGIVDRERKEREEQKKGWKERMLLPNLCDNNGVFWQRLIPINVFQLLSQRETNLGLINRGILCQEPQENLVGFWSGPTKETGGFNPERVKEGGK